MMRKYKKIIILLLLIGISATIFPQNNLTKSGIKFLNGLTWKEIKAKARAENKYIFLDCYTTWCVPCKTMEKSIYGLEEIGSFFNMHFISVKVQMDRTKNDNLEIQSWYKEADKIAKEYSVEAYPTFLFISPEGKAVHRAAGAFDAAHFLGVAKDALNPETQIYTLFDKYDPEKMDTSEMKSKARFFRFSCPELAEKILVAYIRKANHLLSSDDKTFLIEFKKNPIVQAKVQNYIARLGETVLFQKENINLCTQFMQSSQNKSFTFFYKNSDKIDSVMNNGLSHKVWFSKKWIDPVIYKEEIKPVLQDFKDKSQTINWNKIEERVKGKYGSEYSNRNILIAKMNWFKNGGNLEEYVNYVAKYMDRYSESMESDWGLNEYAWKVFEVSNDKKQLQKALKWSSQAVMMAPSANMIDTYANILHKLGRTKDAMKWQEIALKLEPTNHDIQENFAKMKNSQPTW